MRAGGRVGVARSATILPSCIFTVCIRIRTGELSQGYVVCDCGENYMYCVERKDLYG